MGTQDRFVLLTCTLQTQCARELPQQGGYPIKGLHAYVYRGQAAAWRLHSTTEPALGFLWLAGGWGWDHVRPPLLPSGPPPQAHVCCSARYPTRRATLHQTAGIEKQATGDTQSCANDLNEQRTRGCTRQEQRQKQRRERRSGRTRSAGLRLADDPAAGGVLHIFVVGAIGGLRRRVLPALLQHGRKENRGGSRTAWEDEASATLGKAPFLPSCSGLGGHMTRRRSGARRRSPAPAPTRPKLESCFHIHAPHAAGCALATSDQRDPASASGAHLHDALGGAVQVKGALGQLLPHVLVLHHALGACSSETHRTHREARARRGPTRGAGEGGRGDTGRVNAGGRCRPLLREGPPTAASGWVGAG